METNQFKAISYVTLLYRDMPILIDLFYSLECTLNIICHLFSKPSIVICEWLYQKTRAFRFHFQKYKNINEYARNITQPKFNLEIIEIASNVFLPIYYFALLCVCEIKSNFYFFYIGVMGSCSIIISKNMNFAICSVEWTRTINLKLFTRSILVL